MIDPIELLSRRQPVFVIGVETRSAHLAGISEYLQTLNGAAGGSLASRVQTRLYDWRARTVGALAALVLVVPSVAVATDDVRPGESMYPIKRAVEPVWSLVDSDIIARHRVEELRAAIEADGSPYDLLGDAEEAVARLEPGSFWFIELERLKAMMNTTQDDNQREIADADTEIERSEVEESDSDVGGAPAEVVDPSGTDTLDIDHEDSGDDESDGGEADHGDSEDHEDDESGDGDGDDSHDSDDESRDDDSDDGDGHES